MGLRQFCWRVALSPTNMDSIVVFSDGVSLYFLAGY